MKLKIREVASEVGVSVATVSPACNDSGPVAAELPASMPVVLLSVQSALHNAGMHIQSALHNAGLHIRHEVAVAALDDLPLARFAAPSPTAVHAPIRAPSRARSPTLEP